MFRAPCVGSLWGGGGVGGGGVCPTQTLPLLLSLMCTSKWPRTFPYPELLHGTIGPGPMGHWLGALGPWALDPWANGFGRKGPWASAASFWLARFPRVATLRILDMFWAALWDLLGPVWASEFLLSPWAQGPWTHWPLAWVGRGGPCSGSVQGGLGWHPIF